MSECVSISQSLPAQFKRITTFSSNPSTVFRSTPTVCINSQNGIRAVGDRLQTANKPQPQPQRRLVQVPPTGLWDRFPAARTVQQMMETMDRVMEDPLVYSRVAQRESDNGGYSRGRTPWEIKEGEKEYKMRFDMPGMTKQDVKVWVEDKMLVLKAEKQGAEEEEEWPAKSYGKYSTRIALPENVEFDKIKAEVKDGVLYITVPKASTPAKIFDISVN